MHLIGVFAIIPATMLLTVSFFVLFAARKIDVEGIKAFGYVIAFLLWISVALVLLSGAYTLVTGHCPITKALMQDKMEMMCMHKGMMGSMMQGQMQGKMPMAEEKMMKCK